MIENESSGQSKEIDEQQLAHDDVAAENNETNKSQSRKSK